MKYVNMLCFQEQFLVIDYVMTAMQNLSLATVQVNVFSVEKILQSVTETNRAENVRTNMWIMRRGNRDNKYDEY